MAATTLLENFNTIAESTGGVDRLRLLILNLAFCGQLTEAEDTDEQVDLAQLGVSRECIDLSFVNTPVAQHHDRRELQVALQRNMEAGECLTIEP